jgi:hypothetical protein
MANSNCSNIVNLTQARQERELTLRAEPGSMPWSTYTEPKRLLGWPCRVITLPVKGSASSDKK